MSAQRKAVGATYPAWLKSSYSGSGGGDCVEVGLASDAVHVRDSKSPLGAALRVPSEGWSVFVSYVSRQGVGHGW
ncbi:DUF397 domain-containing protein [Streptomyces sp. NPDC051569]|uniref:DUF397 domain-containing protein n=1 Tax=Streptomyces sp. NPDC051569 TaxID=3365661 RepID=UPI00378F58C5